MRQGQQNRRGRGRNNGGGGNNNNNNNNNNHRKSQNPLTRSFESAGPDMKIRGTPAHIAEKYVSLARDALSSGDPVLAENYLQHAEHYNRIILAYREQQMAHGGDQPNGQMMRGPQPGGDPARMEEYGEEDGEGFAGDAAPQPPMHRQPNEQQQPRMFNGPRYDDRPQRQQGSDFQRPHREQRDRQENGARGGYDRGERPERAERGERIERERGERRERPANAEQPSDVAAQQGQQDFQPRRRERFVQQHEQPEFLRRPVRRPRREEPAESAQSDAPEAPADDSGRD